MHDHFKNLRFAFEKVFAHSSYIALASAFAILTFLAAVWLPNSRLLVAVFNLSSAPLETKLKLAWSLLYGIRTNFSLFSAGYTIAIAALLGINIAMITYFLKRTKNGFARRDATAGFGSIISGVLGIGCAACGSFILSALGMAGALAILPLRGGEFGILSIILLMLSLFLTSKKIAVPLTCTAN